MASGASGKRGTSRAASSRMRVSTIWRRRSSSPLWHGRVVMNIDITTEPLGIGQGWPARVSGATCGRATVKEIQQKAMLASVTSDAFSAYASVFEGDAGARRWCSTGDRFQRVRTTLHPRRPPFLENFMEPAPLTADLSCTACWQCSATKITTIDFAGRLIKVDSLAASI